MSECFLCGSTWSLENHHVFFGAKNRKMSDKYKMTVMLCPNCHRISNESVHLNRKVDLALKSTFQSIFEETHTREEFFKAFGRSYL